MKLIRYRLLASLMVTAMFVQAPAVALGAAKNLGTFKTWTAWTDVDEYGPICFISASPQDSQPKEVDGKPINRDPPHFLIIHRQKAVTLNADGTTVTGADGKPVFRKGRNEVQTLVGYPLKPTTDSFHHEADIDGTPYALKSIADEPTTPAKEASAAWIANPTDEPGFVEAVKKGKMLVVKGMSARGTATTDSYSLAGSGAAMAAIDKACP